MYKRQFYRWAQVWPSICAELCDAPKVLAVGDLHVNSFGTWRDAEGRLCWGVDDFDESYPLAYTNDIVRLAASLKIVIDAGSMSIRFKDGCAAILDGYLQSLREGGCPIVLAEREQKLDKLGVDSFCLLYTSPPGNRTRAPNVRRRCRTSKGKWSLAESHRRMLASRVGSGLLLTSRASMAGTPTKAVMP